MLVIVVLLEGVVGDAVLIVVAVVVVIVEVVVAVEVAVEVVVVCDPDGLRKILFNIWEFNRGSVNWVVLLL